MDETPKLDRKERNALKKVDGILEVFRHYGARKRQAEDAAHNSGDMHLTLGQSTAFLTVAMNEGLSLAELGEIAGIPQSTMSRYMLDLGLQMRDRRPSFGLVNIDVDPMNLRRKIYTLSEKGRLMKADLVAKAGG